MAEGDKSFWATVPGILTGVAAIITAIGGLYVALSRSSAPPPASTPMASTQTAPTSPPPAAAAPPARRDPTQWPLIAADDFGGQGSRWYQGSLAHDNTMSGRARIVDGVYRWEVDYFESQERPIEAPYEPASAFMVAVDVRMPGTQPGKGGGLLFGRLMSTDYTFVLSAERRFIVKRFDGKVDRVLIDWTPVDVEPRQRNRLAVLVDGERVELFINDRTVGEFKEPSFRGGKVGVAATGWNAGPSLLEFDNFEYRRKPD